MVLTDKDILLWCTANIEGRNHRYGDDYAVQRQWTTNKPLLDPFEPELIENINGQGIVSYGLSCAGYDIRLGNEFKVPKIDPKRGDVSISSLVVNPYYPESIDYQRYTLKDDEYFILGPKQFVLAHSVEWFNMPDCLCASVRDKSTWIRLGIQCGNTFIEPGWSGILTLELKNQTDNPIMLPIGHGIAQIVFDRLTGIPNMPYWKRKGKYQGQIGVQTPKMQTLGFK